MGMERQTQFQGISRGLEKARGGFSLWTVHQALKAVGDGLSPEPGGPREAKAAPGLQALQAFSPRHAERSSLNIRSCLSSPEGIAKGFCTSHSHCKVGNVSYII